MRIRTNYRKVSDLTMWSEITSKKIIQNRLSALLRACRPGRLILVCRAMEKKLPKNTDVFWSIWEPQYQEANIVFPNTSPVILKKPAKNGLFSTCVYPAKIGKSNQLAILSGLHQHYEKLSAYAFLFDKDSSYSLLRSLGRLSLLTDWIV